MFAIKCSFLSVSAIPWHKHWTAPYLAIFEQGGSADIFSLITGGGRDYTSKSIIVTLSNLRGGATAPPAPPP